MAEQLRKTDAGAGAEGGHGLPGAFITFEGGDGVGKSTHIGLLADALAARGCEVVRVREPGGTAIGEALRALVLDPANGQMAPETELLIYEAARAQVMAEVIRPALARGAVVLCDRFFDSTVAYQAFGRGLDRGFIDAANAFATGGTAPDRTILLVVDQAQEGLERASELAEPDRLEAEGAAFHNKVAAGFAALAAEEPARVRVVSSEGSVQATQAAIAAELADLFPWLAGTDGEAAAPGAHAAPAASSAPASAPVAPASAPAPSTPAPAAPEEAPRG